MMSRRFTTLALMALCVASMLALPLEARKNRMGRALSSLYCEIQLDDARREARKLRGLEFKKAHEAAERQFEECKKKARRANQVEEVMPRLVPR